MPGRRDGMKTVRAQLCGEIDRLAAGRLRLPSAQVAAHIRSIRATAAEFHLAAVVEISGALERSVETEGRGPLMQAYLDAMRDATGCTRAEPGAGAPFLASVGVRMIG